MEFVLIAIAILLVGLVLGVSLLVGRGRRTTRLDDDAAAGTTLTRPRPPTPTTEAPPRPGGATASGTGTTAEPDAVSPEARPEVELPPATAEPGLVFETPPPSAGRLVRLRSRLARSQSNLGRGLLTVLARERLTEDDWEEVEETLLAADVGVAATQQIVDRLRTQSMVLATASGAELRQLLVRELTTVRGREGADPASVAFEAARTGVEGEVDTVVVDTAGRLHTKGGLMDELGKIKRVVEKVAPVTEVLLVLDATTGQNGVVQARVFTEAVTVTGVVLTKLDGTAKGGIVVSVQRELGIPVKLVGLGEGPDDLAPFEPRAFAEAIVGGEA